MPWTLSVLRLLVIFFLFFLWKCLAIRLGTPFFLFSLCIPSNWRRVCVTSNIRASFFMGEYPSYVILFVYISTLHLQQRRMRLCEIDPFYDVWHEN